MSTFREYLAEQLQDPELRKWWEGRNELLVRQVNATMTLSDMPLTEMDKMRIRYAAEHPEEIDAILDELIREHTVDTHAFDAAVSEFATGELRKLYDGIQALQEELTAQHHDAEIGCLDYKVIKALAATYELQDYLAGRITQAKSLGEE